MVKARGWSTGYADIIDPDVLDPFTHADFWVPGLTADATDPDAFLLVAVDDTAVVGLAHGTFTPGPYLSSLHVQPEHRGAGIGARIMLQVAQAAIERGHSTLRLDVVTSNTRAYAFYLRLGAEPEGVHPARWAPGVQEVRVAIPDLRNAVTMSREGSPWAS